MTDPMRSRGAPIEPERGVVSASWADVIAPVLARFEVAAAFGMTAEHNAVGADAVAKIMRQMAEKLDAAVAINDAALARAEKAEGELAGLAEVLTKNDVPRARTSRNMSLAERVQLVCTTVEIVSRNAEDAADEALARNRALEEGLRPFSRPAATDCVTGGGVLTVSNGKKMFLLEAADFTRARALLAPASPETTDGKDAT